MRTSDDGLEWELGLLPFIGKPFCQKKKENSVSIIWHLQIKISLIDTQFSFRGTEVWIHWITSVLLSGYKPWLLNIFLFFDMFYSYFYIFCWCNFFSVRIFIQLNNSFFSFALTRQQLIKTLKKKIRKLQWLCRRINHQKRHFPHIKCQLKMQPYWSRFEKNL